MERGRGAGAVLGARGAGGRGEGERGRPEGLRGGRHGQGEVLRVRRGHELISIPIIRTPTNSFPEWLKQEAPGVNQR